MGQLYDKGYYSEINIFELCPLGRYQHRKMIHELAICNVDQLESCDNLKMYDILVTMKDFFSFDNLLMTKFFSDSGLFLYQHIIKAV